MATNPTALRLCDQRIDSNNMKNINIKLTTNEARILSKVLKSICWMFKDLKIFNTATVEIQNLKELIDIELLKQ